MSDPTAHVEMTSIDEDEECPCFDRGDSYSEVRVAADGWAYCSRCGAEWDVNDA